MLGKHESKHRRGEEGGRYGTVRAEKMVGGGLPVLRAVARPQRLFPRVPFSVAEPTQRTVAAILEKKQRGHDLLHRS